jgi:hypothetical protein
VDFSPGSADNRAAAVPLDTLFLPPQVSFMLDRKRKLGGAVRPYFGGRGAKQPTRPAAEVESTASAAAPAATVSQPPAPSESPLTLKPSLAPKIARPSLREMVGEVASAAGWGVLEMGEDIQIDVRTPGDRSQIVSVSFAHPDREDESVAVISSICGPLQEHNAGPLLRYNAKLPYGAFAVERMADRQEMVVLRATLPGACLDSAALGRVIAEIASRADKVEGKLTGRDHF